MKQVYHTAKAGFSFFCKKNFILFIFLTSLVSVKAATYTSQGNGDWNNAGTWGTIPGGIPGNNDIVIIQPNHYVYTTSNITRDANTFVNGWFEIRSGGYAGGSVNMTYSQTDGGLVFSHNYVTNSVYGVGNGNSFWPVVNGPYNLIINSQARVALQSSLAGTRTIAGTATLNDGIYVDYASALSISGSLLIQANGFIGNNSPVYLTGSQLKYSTGGNYEAGLEWPQSISVPTAAGIGVPSNVQVSNNTNFYFNSGLSSSQYCFGKLTIDANSTLSQNSQGLVVKGNYSLAGRHNYANVNTFTSFNGSLLYVAGCTNFTNGRTTTLTNPTTVQTISSTGGTVPNFNCLQLAGTGSLPVSVQLNTDVTIDGNAGINAALLFSFASDVLDLNGFQLTVGTAGSASEITNSGSFKGSASSRLIINGNSTNTTPLKFVTGSATLQSLTINRTGATPAAVLSTPLSVTNLNLTSGIIDIAAHDLTLLAGGSTTTNNTNFIRTSGAGLFKRQISGNGTYLYPIGVMNYSPAIIVFNSATYAAGANLGVNVVGSAPTTNTATQLVKINRFWNTSITGITGYNADISFNYLDGDVTNASLEGSMKIGGYNGTNWRMGPAVDAPGNLVSETGIQLLRPLYTAADAFSPTVSTDFYRSVSSGPWSSALTWETSPNGLAPWSTPTASPDFNANTITIQATHNVSVSTNINFDQLTVNGTLTLANGGVITMYDPTGDDMTINSGGKFIIAKTGAGTSESYSNSVVAGTSQTRVKTGGAIQIIGASSNATGYERLMSNPSNTWENASTYQHQSPSTPLSLTGGITLFPNAAANVVPILKIDNLSGDYSSSATITLNGLLESNTTLNITTNGIRNFRNGFTGSGTINFPAGGSSLNITGTPSVISGSLTLSLNRILNINDNLTIPTSSAITIQNGSIGNIAIAAGKTLTIANSASLDIGNTAVFSGGTGTLVLDGIFKTSNTSNTGGFTASRPSNTVIGPLSTVEYNGTNQTVGLEPYANLTISNSGTKSGSIVRVDSTLYITGSSKLDATGSVGNTAASNKGRLKMDGSSILVLRTIGQQPLFDSTYTLSGTSTIEFANTSGTAQTIRGTPLNVGVIGYQNIVVSGSNVAQSNNNITLNASGSLLIKSGGVYTQTNRRFIPNGVGQSVLIENGGTFRVGLAAGFNGGTTAIDGAITNITLQPNSTIEYSDAGSQTITNANSLIYGNIKLSGSGIKTAPAGILELKGDFTSLLNTANDYFAHNNGTVYFSNTSAQQYAGNSGSVVAFYNLQTQNSASDGLVMSTDAIVENELKLNTASTKMSVNGSLILRSTATRTAYVAPILAATDPFKYPFPGTSGFVVERYLPGFKSWRLLSTPIQNDGSSPSIYNSWQEAGNLTTSVAGYGVQLSSPLAPGNGFDYYSPFPSIKVYNSVTNLYDQVINTTTTPISNPLGYYVFVRGDRAQGATSLGFVPTTLRMKGKIKVLDQPALPVLAGKYNTLSNPYPSRIAFKTITKVNLADAFTVWNPALYGANGVGGFELYALENATLRYRNTATGAYRDSLESGEAVFVQNNAISDGSYTIKESDKRSGSSTVSKINGVPEPELKIMLHTNDANGADYVPAAAHLNFDPSYSNGIDNDDARKFINATENVSIIKSNGLLEVECREMVTVTDTLFLSVSKTKQQGYSFSMEASNIIPSGIQAYLKDAYANAETPFSLDGITTIPFVVNADAGSYAPNRFMIIFKPAAVLPVTFTNINAIRNTDRSISVNWNTENESALQNYTVERSFDGISFTAIGNKAPVNSGSISTYSYPDPSASTGVNYYRVISKGVSGETKQSATILVKAMTNSTYVQVVPNPVTDGTIRIRSQMPAGNYSAALYDTKGSKVMQRAITQIVGSVLNIKVGEFPVGLYDLVLTSETGEVVSVKVSIQ